MKKFFDYYLKSLFPILGLAGGFLYFYSKNVVEASVLILSSFLLAGFFFFYLIKNNQKV